MPDNCSESAARRQATKDIIRLVTVATFFIAAALVLKSPYVRQELLDVNHLRNKLQGGGLSHVMLFTGTCALINAMGIPRVWICGIAGTLFGAVEGSLWGFTATLIGSSINFVMGRSLLRGPIKRHLPERLRKWYKAFNENGFQAILYMRLFPLANSTLTNLLGGASQLSFRNYLLATAIGFLPLTLTFAMLGSSAAKHNHWQLLGGLLLFATVALGQWMWIKFRRGSDENTDSQACPAVPDDEPLAGKDGTK